MSGVVESLIASPLFAPLVPQLRRFLNCNEPPSLEELNLKLSNAGVTFVAQGNKTNDFADSYEPRIFLKGEVQTRERNWHDFFNALVWDRFPKTKKKINSLQYELQKSHFPDKTRLPAENMLTLFDENGAIVIAHDPALIELIREHKWHELFWEQRAKCEKDLEVLVFGHALYEKSMRPYIGLTAQCLLLLGPKLNALDSYVADYLNTKGVNLQTDDLDPLPILGVPGWWAENTNERFYRNKKYFRSL